MSIASICEKLQNKFGISLKSIIFIIHLVSIQLAFLGVYSHYWEMRCECIRYWYDYKQRKEFRDCRGLLSWWGASINLVESHRQIVSNVNDQSNNIYSIVFFMSYILNRSERARMCVFVCWKSRIIYNYMVISCELKR